MRESSIQIFQSHLREFMGKKVDHIDHISDGILHIHFELHSSSNKKEKKMQFVVHGDWRFLSHKKQICTSIPSPQYSHQEQFRAIELFVQRKNVGKLLATQIETKDKKILLSFVEEQLLEIVPNSWGNLSLSQEIYFPLKNKTHYIIDRWNPQTQVFESQETIIKDLT